MILGQAHGLRKLLPSEKFLRQVNLVATWTDAK